MLSLFDENGKEKQFTPDIAEILNLCIAKEERLSTYVDEIKSMLEGETRGNLTPVSIHGTCACSNFPIFFLTVLCRHGSSGSACCFSSNLQVTLSKHRMVSAPAAGMLRMLRKKRPGNNSTNSRSALLPVNGLFTKLKCRSLAPCASCTCCGLCGGGIDFK